MSDPPVAGIDVGGTFVKWVLLGDGAERIDDGVRRLPDDGVFEAVADLGAELVGRGARAVGVGVAGLVVWPEGEFVWGPHVPGRSVPYRRRLSDTLGVPAVVDNDANLAALAELRLGAARGHRHALMLTFGTGIGAGMVVDRQIFRGRNFAGEVGHMVLDPDGPLCACGRRGCWETFVSGSRLDQLAAELADRAPDGALARLVGADRPEGRHLTAAAAAGDPAARAALAEVGGWLGRGVANLVAIFDPEVVVIGGAAAQAGDHLLDPARKVVGQVLQGAEYRPDLPMVPAVFGPLAGAVGAAILATETLL